MLTYPTHSFVKISLWEEHVLESAFGSLSSANHKLAGLLQRLLEGRLEEK